MTYQTENTPSLRFPEFTVDWEETTLGEISKKVLKKNRDEKIKHVLTNSATQGIVNQQDYFDKDIANQNNLSGYYIVEKDNFIYNPRISQTAPVGPIKRNKLIQGVMSPLYTIFRINTGNLDYFEYYFETAYWYEYLKGIANSGARHDRMNISQEDFFNMPLPIPSFEEQTKIANFLTAIDERISQLQQQKSLLESYKKGVMQKLFSQEIRFKNDSGEDFPDWEEKTLGEVSFEIKRNSKDKIENLEVLTISSGKGFISQQERFSQVIAGQSLSKYTILQKDEFSYNRGASKKYQYGCIYALKNHEEALVPNVYISFRLDKNLVPEFYNQLFSTGYANNQLRQFISSSVRLDGLLNINREDFFSISIPIPLKEEQTKIANFLTAIDTKIEGVKNQLETTQTYKKGLLQQLFI